MKRLDVFFDLKFVVAQTTRMELARVVNTPEAEENNTFSYRICAISFQREPFQMTKCDKKMIRFVKWDDNNQRNVMSCTILYT